MFVSFEKLFELFVILMKNEIAMRYPFNFMGYSFPGKMTNRFRMQQTEAESHFKHIFFDFTYLSFPLFISNSHLFMDN